MTQPPERGGCGSPERPLATVRNLHKAFGDQKVLRGVDVDFHSGGFTFVVGPSGTGKSVLVRHLIGLLRPDEGEVTYQGERVDKLEESQLLELRKRCVYVFQHPTLFDSMSVTENVSVVLRYHRQLTKTQADDLAKKRLESLGLAAQADRLPAELSTSEQKMVSIARALALDPETLILDEPTTGLDPYAAHEMDRQISLLHSQGVTLIVISHDLRSIQRLAQKVVFLMDGKLKFSGLAGEFFQSTDPQIRQFIEGRVDPVPA